MARSTARRIAGKTAAAAKRVTAGVTRQSTGSSASASKSPPAKPATTKSTSKKAPATGAATKSKAKQSSASKAPAKKAPAKTAAAKTSKTAATKTVTRKSSAKKTSAKAGAGTPTVSAPATRTGSKNGSAAKTGAAKTSAAKAGAAKAGAAKASAATTSAGKLAVKSDEKPWTAKELAEVRGELNEDRQRLRSELNLAEEELQDLMRDAGDGAGNDQADVGSTTFERDHEMSLANNAREMLAQTERALGRIEDGTYGVCESCGQPIGKNRLMAFPRATLCLSCKQREERR
jgi:RNA polymerase-binding protein DksA